MKKTLSILILLLSMLTLNAQSVKKLRVYQKGGAVDTLVLRGGASVSHSQYDLTGRYCSDYVSMEVNSGDTQRRYLIEEIDSIVLPNGRHVVFNGVTSLQPNYSKPMFDPGQPLTSPRRSSFSGQFPGAGTGNVTFFWTENDRLRLEDGSLSRAENLTNNRTNATFVFENLDMDYPSCMVYYPDKLVTISNVQRQTGADNSDHIGESGDCGMATATLDENDESYHFILQHKAAYLCFLPHIDYMPSAKVTKILVQCDQPIAGTWQQSPTGLLNAYNTSKSITLLLNAQPQKPRDFYLEPQLNQNLNAAYMVIAPQSAERQFTVTYYVTDTLSRFHAQYQQSFKFQPKANTVYPVTCRIPESVFYSLDMGYDYIWSGVNMGATLPSDIGNYYAWGETATRNEFTSDNYLTRIGQDTLDIGGTKYDAARQLKGSDWRLPTETEWSELLDKCTWKWGTYNGVDGWMVSGTNNGNEDMEPHRLFFPMTGYKEGSDVQEGSNSYLWMATREDSVSHQAHSFMLSRDEKKKVLMDNWKGLNIRPVKTLPRSYNIPYSGTNYVDLRSHPQDFSVKVYDHAGPSGNYDNKADGYLNFSCAEGYRMNVKGSVNSEGCDPIYVYDIINGGNSLVRSAAGWGSSIDVNSKTNNVSLYFHSDYSVIGAGLNLTVTLLKHGEKHLLTINPSEGGTVTTQSSLFNPEDTVWLMVTPKPGYVLHHVKVQTTDSVFTAYDDDPRYLSDPAQADRHNQRGDTVLVRDNNWCHQPFFIMPYGDAVLTPYFTEDESALYANMPYNGTEIIKKEYIQWLIDNGWSFHIYDHGGKNGYYSNSVNNYMLIEIPDGYELQIEGTMNVEGGCDPLYIYDGNSSSASLLVKGESSSVFNVTSHNNALFLYFHSDSSVIRPGFDLKVTPQKKE